MLIRGVAGAPTASRAALMPCVSSQSALHRFPHAECSYRPRLPYSSKSTAPGPRYFSTTPWTRQSEPAPASTEKQKRPTRAQARLQDRAALFAQAMKERSESREPQPTSSRDMVDLTPPDLADFQRVVGKPRVRDYKKQYAERMKLYEAAFNRLNGAFTVKQLRALDAAQAREDGEAAASRVAIKPMLLQRLMGKHGWPVPVDESADQVQESQVFDLPANELFLFLRDTHSLQNLMMKGGVTFSIAEGGTDGAPGEGPKLKADGPRYGLAHLARTLESKRKHMTIGTVDLAELHGFQPLEALTHFLSLVSGAYVEPYEAGFRISSMRPGAVESARKLLFLASVRAHSLAQARQLVALQAPQSPFAPDQHPNVALIPFFPSPSHLIPWETLTTSFASLLFRLKRPSQWRTVSGPSSIRAGSAIAESLVNPVLRSSSAEAQQGFHDFLLHVRGGLPSGTSTSTSIAFGHFVVPPTSGSSSALTPPMPGELPIDGFKPFFASSSRPIFTPGLAPAMVLSPPGGSRKRLRRLSYRSLDGRKAATFVFTHPSSETDEFSKGQDSQHTQSWLDRLDEMIARMSNKQPEYKAPQPVSPPAMPSDTPSAQLPSGTIAESGDELPEDFSGIFDAHLSSMAEVDVMMPDHPVDARLSVRNSTSLSQDQIPDGVLSFFDTFTENLAAQKPANPSILDPHEAGVAQPPKIIITPPPLQISLTDPQGSEIELMLEADEDVETTEEIGEEGAVSRVVKVKDMAIGVDRIVSHSEIEADGLDLEPLWAELGRSVKDEPETSLFSQSSWLSSALNIKPSRG